MDNIIILDYSNCAVYMAKYDNEKFKDYEDFYTYLNEKRNLNLSSSNCHCMIAQELTIDII